MAYGNTATITYVKCENIVIQEIKNLFYQYLYEYITRNHANVYNN